ncbi:hypothetical protein DERF_004593 [Dermatophagoides farinae]|uniref:Uncharacterized protein n=1 Tax=Dermatophagoides farinae TaxID=6954 RepID=A0A922L6C8_DERFA|nr:hypothetical protein DERF_004593 [Dermatophagoides farinae]
MLLERTIDLFLETEIELPPEILESSILLKVVVDDVTSFRMDFSGTLFTIFTDAFAFGCVLKSRPGHQICSCKINSTTKLTPVLQMQTIDKCGLIY